MQEYQSKIEFLSQRLQANRPITSAIPIKQQVQLALARFSQLAESVLCPEPDYKLITQIIQTVDAKLYMRFQQVARGKRTFSVPAGGVLTLGSTPPPVPLYDGPTGRAVIRKMLDEGEVVQRGLGCVAPGESCDGKEEGWSANVQRGTTRST
jgi:hypothetical protein